jgi:hypothetical protein
MLSNAPLRCVFDEIVVQGAYIKRVSYDEMCCMVYRYCSSRT